MCRVLQTAAEHLVYQHRFGDGDDLDAIIRDLGQHMKRYKRLRREGKSFSGPISSLPRDLEATSLLFQSDDSDISTVTLASETNAKLKHALERRDRDVVSASDSEGLGCGNDQSQTVCEYMMHPPDSVRAPTAEDFIFVRPGNNLTKGALDYLLSSLDHEGVDIDRSRFHIWPAISMHDPTGDDYTSTWSLQGVVRPFNNLRYQLLPYLCSYHWQLAVFDKVAHTIFRYDSFGPDGVDRFPFVVRLIPQL
jgi:hypothetical protein